MTIAPDAPTDIARRQRPLVAEAWGYAKRARPDTPPPAEPTAPTVAALPRPRRGWQRDAACDPTAQGDRPCGTCPVRWDCLLDAVHTDDRHTFRAGMTPNDRQEWLREEGILPEPVPAPRASGKVVTIDMVVVERMRSNGVGWPQIAPLFDCAPETVARRWKRAHAPVPAPAGPKPPRTVGPRKPLDLDLVGRLLADGWSYKKIGRRLGVGDDTVRKQWRRAQLEQTGGAA